ncbi:ELMO/CED-12 family domain-containing protein [Ditylenchus destructor]|uniref:ELMO/CED-12 family domain-containing protein n=1 Tax=Ditylenchus destructor TaxID=166010 RepID=A0AAD4N406_9BILA|nr:ELMO/CED-12 family domain-containing protein [Ditylenchus destructor]
MPIIEWIKAIITSAKLIIVDVLLSFAELLGRKPSIDKIIVSKRDQISSKNQMIEEILREYPNDRINNLDWDTGDETEAAEAILEESVNDEDRRLDLSKSLAKSMRQIRGYQKLCQEVEERRLINYDSKNKEHEALLAKLWKLLMDGEELRSRKTNQWQQIGFQGDDPATDFRGMGILGLEQLVFFAQFDVDRCRRVLLLSHHPTIGFPFAVCGITITAICKELLFDDLLKNHFYNVLRESPTLDSFHQVYCRVFDLFATYWEMEKPESIMEFNPVKQRFLESLESYLRNDGANLVNAKFEDLL